MATARSPVYFSCADRQLESYLDKGAFERSLLVDILFQDGVLIPDIFFFISSGVAHHLDKPTESLLEAGLRSGDIIPSFRGKTSCFADALRVAKGTGDPQQAILGIRDDADAIANRLDVTVANTRNFAPACWPEWDLGLCFQRRIEKYLANTAPPSLPDNCGIPQDRMIELWDYTEPWRKKCVQEAVEETQRVAGVGLRRGLLITAVGRAVGLVPAGGKVNDVAELLNPSLPPEDLHALHYYCRWITDIYQYNQACELSAIPSFPQCEPLAGAFANEIMQRQYQKTDAKSERTELRLEARMPTPAALSHVSPSELLRIKNDVGTAYFAALRAWEAAEGPSAALEQNVRNALNKYGNALVREVNRQGPASPGSIEALLSRSKGIGPILPWFLGNTAAMELYKVRPLLGVLMAVGTNAYAVYRWWRRRPRSTEVRLRHLTSWPERSKKPDVNLLNQSQSLGISSSEE